MRTLLHDKYTAYEKEGKLKFSMKSIFVPKKDHLFIAVDLKQAESWVVAYAASEDKIKYALQHGDFHTQTAAMLHNIPENEVTKIIRYPGKQQNHARSYGMGDLRSTQTFNKQSDKWPYLVTTIEQHRNWGRMWHDFYPGIKNNYWTMIQKMLEEKVIVNPYGTWRQFFDVGEELWKQGYAHYAQGTVSDHFKGAVQDELGIKGGLLEVHKRFVDTHKLKLLNEAHDSFLGEAHKDSARQILADIVPILQRPMVIHGETFTIPCDCEIGDRWGEMEEVKI